MSDYQHRVTLITRHGSAEVTDLEGHAAETLADKMLREAETAPRYVFGRITLIGDDDYTEQRRHFDKCTQTE